MPRVLRLGVATPVMVLAAFAVLGTEVRAHLVRYFLHHPGAQIAAAEALGVTKGTISDHVAVLLADGVLYAEPATDKRSSIYRVNVDRLDELLSAASSFFFDEDATIER